MFEELAEKSADMFKFASLDTSDATLSAVLEEEGWKSGDLATAVRVYAPPDLEQVVDSGWTSQRKGKWLDVAADVDMKSLYGQVSGSLPSHV
eukprot:SAG31_NODE_11747_length_1001_cov_1.223947_1_plen_91_part_01